jgi:hypothetical protein
MKPKCSLPHSQVPSICPYPEPDQSSPYPPSRFLKIHQNIILPFTPRYPKWSLSLRFPHQNPVYATLVPHRRYFLSPAFCTRVMTVYLVLSVFTSRPVSLLAATNASACPFTVCTLPSKIYLHYQHKPEADVYQLISIHPGLPEPSWWHTLRTQFRLYNEKAWRQEVLPFFNPYPANDYYSCTS